MIYFTIPDHHSNPPFGGPPGLNNDQQHIMPPFEVGLGPPMMGGHPNGGPSPPLHTGLPPLGSHLSGIEGLMDLQTVGHYLISRKNTTFPHCGIYVWSFDGKKDAQFPFVKLLELIWPDKKFCVRGNITM